MLCDPPRLVTKLAVEIHEPLTLSATSIGYHRENVFAKPRQQLQANIWTHVLSRWILGRSLKLLLEFRLPGWIEFKEKTSAVLQCNVVGLGKRIIFFAQRVN